MKLITAIFSVFLLTSPCAFSSEVTSSEPSASPQPAQKSPEPPANIRQMDVCNNEIQLIGSPGTGEAKGNYTCTMALDPDFGKIMMEIFPRCAKETALKMGMNVPTHIRVYQEGAFNVRKTVTPSGTGDKWSRHSTGKAMDVEGIALDYGDEKLGSTFIKFTEDSNGPNFYSEFRECWKNATVKDANGKSCTCSIGPPGSKEPCNDVHKDHAHFAVSCPVIPGVAGC